MNPLAHKRQQLLQQMEQIDRMERGSLQAETRASQRNPNQQRGPYFKHQIWEDGQNKTRRVDADQADALAQAIEGRKEFEKLAEQFVDATVAMTNCSASFSNSLRPSIAWAKASAWSASTRRVLFWPSSQI